MQTHKILYILYTVLILASCEVRQPAQKVPGSIEKYYSCRDGSGSCEVAVLNDECILAFKLGTYLTSDYEYAFGNDKTTYYELCAKYGDMIPDGRWCFDSGGGNNDMYGDALAESVRAIHITSDAAWDDEHDAHALLDDIFVVRYSSFWPYVQNGWSGEYLTYFEKRISDMSDNDLYFISYVLELSTTSVPTVAVQHTLAVDFLLDTGETVAYEAAVDFSATETQHK